MFTYLRSATLWLKLHSSPKQLSVFYYTYMYIKYTVSCIYTFMWPSHFNIHACTWWYEKIVYTCIVHDIYPVNWTSHILIVFLRFNRNTVTLDTKRHDDLACSIEFFFLPKRWSLESTHKSDGPCKLQLSIYRSKWPPWSMTWTQ